MAPDIDGVFPKYSQLNDVISVSARGDRDLLATGDDFGLVKLFRFPASKRGAKFRKYNRHSAHVTNVTWTNDGQFLLFKESLNMTFLKVLILTKNGQILN